MLVRRRNEADARGPSGCGGHAMWCDLWQKPCAARDASCVVRRPCPQRASSVVSRPLCGTCTALRLPAVRRCGHAPPWCRRTRSGGNSTGRRVTVLLHDGGDHIGQALAQHGLEPAPSQRTISRLLHRYAKEGTESNPHPLSVHQLGNVLPVLTWLESQGKMAT